MLNGAKQWESEFPEAVNIIRNDFYMDDCASGANSVEKALKLAKEVKFVLGKSGFDLCKWRSNSEQLVNELGGEETDAVSFDELEQTSILGLKWLPKQDQFTFEVKEHCVETEKNLTKRMILSTISQLFDPNEFVSPAIVQAKLLMQEIWCAKLDWDVAVPTEIEKKWIDTWSCIKCVDAHLQLHGFADSSGKAYGCVVYLRVINSSGEIKTNLIVSKSKVAPLKKVSIPRLELAATELLSKLMM